MAQADGHVRDALDAIASADLTPIEHLLLSDFVKQAVDPGYAAKFILECINDNHGMSIEETLRRFKWSLKQLVKKCELASELVVEVPPLPRDLVQQRDGPGCSIEPHSKYGVLRRPEPVYIIPPTVFDDSDMNSQDGELFPAMEAFLTSSKISELQSVLQCNKDKVALKNLWLLSPTFHSAFRNGHIQVQRLNRTGRWTDEDEVEDPSATRAQYILFLVPPEECTGLFFSDGRALTGFMRAFDMHTDDPTLYCLPSPMLFRVHYRFAALLHHFYVEDHISVGWPRPPIFTIGKRVCQVIRSLWYVVPKVVRVMIYRRLRRVGKSRYPIQFSPLVQRLPFGLYLKMCARCNENEQNALKLVERYTSIPAPLFVDTFQDENETFFVMTGVRGQRLEQVFHRMSYKERDQLIDDISRYVGQLRHIPNVTAYPIANTVGGPVIDHRIPDGRGGPFKAESDFNHYISDKRGSPEERRVIASVHSRKHQVIFTHSDLHPSNILIDRGRLSGIVDWECAGYMPEYWEFTKAMCGVLNREQWEDLWRHTFGTRYEAELKAERILWDRTPPGS
ncbi:hypothetical protein PRK78_005295 [Emydomyces testavorans]|uniref:Aminoglycoside phosphotransferase domain-containing protein n=1 Tax=Emydomyces testavorans TaxID=2070801 RepID=A0AAF0IJD5_9EURO|nr:hypothetical protein PRK78_005295 [Emydomyces testavorans]